MLKKVVSLAPEENGDKGTARVHYCCEFGGRSISRRREFLILISRNLRAPSRLLSILSQELTREKFLRAVKTYCV